MYFVSDMVHRAVAIMYFVSAKLPRAVRICTLYLLWYVGQCQCTLYLSW